ncbi:hypothetical protein OH77DRAFT_793436 [Trametes cingulata]|nr:hypothetical protein OH77DRAFT_793436 [Trametes cingulata]
MQLFRSVFIVAAAAVAFVASEAPQASAFILPMTRYMLDAVPEGAEGAEGSTDATNVAPLADTAESTSADTNIPVAVDTPPIPDVEEQPANASPPPEDTQESSTSETPVSEPSSPVEASSLSTSAASTIPSSFPQDNILAQTNAAGPAVGIGGPTTILIGSMLVTVFFNL